MTKDARQKLRDMGGIMASSPDLIQAVQKFNNGGPIMPMPPRGPSGPNFAPRMPPAPMSGIRPSSLQVPPLAGTLPVVPRESTAGRAASNLGGITMADWRKMSRSERKAAGFPVSEIGAQLFFDRFGVGMGLVDPDARYTSEGPVGVEELLERSSRLDTTDDARAERGFGRTGYLSGLKTPGDKRTSVEPSRRELESEEFRETVFGIPKAVGSAFYEGPLSDVAGFGQRGAGLGLDALGGVASVLGMDKVSAELERRSDRLYNQATSNIMRGVSATAGMDPAQFDMEPAQFNAIIKAAEETAGSAEPTPNESPIASEETQIPEQELSPEETIMAQPLVPENINDETLDRMRKLVESDPNITPPPPGGGDDKPTKRDLRSRYNDQLALMQEIYGLEDKDEAQERAMSLAMIGLAIAAGQSPNALTNIAQGAMVGLQGMGERRDAARERERGLKTLALQTAIDQQAAEAEAEAEAAKLEAEAAEKELDRKNRLAVARIRSASGTGSSYTPERLRQQTIDKILADPYKYPQLLDEETQTLDPDKLKIYVDRIVSPTAPEIPTISTREEYEALPSGAKFMQNGQERIKP